MPNQVATSLPSATRSPPYGSTRNKRHIHQPRKANNRRTESFILMEQNSYTYCL